MFYALDAVLTRRVSTDGIATYVSPLLESVGVVHGFSTRIGGLSPSPFESLNLGNPSDTSVRDDYDNIEENYRRLQRALGCKDGQVRCSVHQVHGGDVMRIERGAAFANGVRADAMITDDPQKILSVRVADCVSVLLCAAEGRTVAAIHAGWRGVIAQVIPHAVRAVVDRGASEVLAAIGPCIGFDAFEVGAEVLREFEAAFGASAPIRCAANGKGHVDLRQAVRMQLEASGIPAICIDTTDRCTYRDSDEFFSHRRDRGLTGRMAALIAPRA